MRLENKAESRWCPAAKNASSIEQKGQSQIMGEKLKSMGRND